MQKLIVEDQSIAALQTLKRDDNRLEPKWLWYHQPIGVSQI